MAHSQAQTEGASELAPKPSPSLKATSNRPVGPDGVPLKPCCVCLETKGIRDECIINKGQENCGDFIEAHKKCLRDLGFNI